MAKNLSYKSNHLEKCSAIKFRDRFHQPLRGAKLLQLTKITVIITLKLRTKAESSDAIFLEKKSLLIYAKLS